MTLERSLRIVFVLCCLSSFALGEERFALQGIADSTFSNRNLSFPYYDTPDSQTLWNGGFTLLGSFQLKDNLTAFYEGRVNHSEGLSGTSPRLQSTRTDPVLQGYLRYSPRLAWDLNIQVGKFGTPFGEFLTRNYSNENPLIGYPLIYTHRTSVSAEYLPTGPEKLLSYRGRPQGTGFYAVGSNGAWLPLVNFAYPTGAMAFGNPGRWDYRFAVVNSSLSNPLNLGTPGQRLQWVGAGGVRCFPGLHAGISYAEGPYLNGSVGGRLAATGHSVSDFKQRALGVDLQYAVHHLEVYAEFIFNRFDVPNITESLGAKGYYIEVKQTLTPRIFAAVRWNQIYFGRLQYEPTSGEHPRFDDNVDSLEVGMGYRFTEKLLSKFSYQYNRTLSDIVPRENVFTAQLVYSLDIRSLLRIR